MNDPVSNFINPGYLDHSVDELSEELKLACWNVLHDNPGIEHQGWVETISKQYPSEVVDTFGTDPVAIMRQLSGWWERETYLDPITGICCTFSEWSEYFANEKSIQLYDLLENVMTSNKVLQ